MRLSRWTMALATIALLTTSTLAQTPQPPEPPAPVAGEPGVQRTEVRTVIMRDGNVVSDETRSMVGGWSQQGDAQARHAERIVDMGRARFMQVQGAMLNFSVSEEVRTAPDQASLSAGVQSMAPTATEAMRMNSRAMERVIAAIKARGIKAEDIQTRGINLNAQYDYNSQRDGQPPRFIGYQVTNTVNVLVRDLGKNADKLGTLLDVLASEGATNINGPNFSVSNADAMLAGARNTALAKAEAKARDYARLAGFADVQLVQLTEGHQDFSPRPYAGDIVVTGSRINAAPKAPMEPGLVGNTLTLSLQYRMIPARPDMPDMPTPPKAPKPPKK